MKKKLFALVCALALTFSFAGCTISTPDTVGSIGDFEITSGMYLLAQYGAYQQAAQLAGSDQDASDVKAFLKETITTDSDSGETAVVSDYVAQKTLENLESYAAIETRFDELGGVLTLDEETQADSYASQLMEQNGDLYKANGIGLDTLKRFERIFMIQSGVVLKKQALRHPAKRHIRSRRYGSLQHLLHRKRRSCRRRFCRCTGPS